MKRIYHSHDKWEEVEYGMYENTNPKDKNILIQKVIYYFNNEELVKYCMGYVVDNFKFACEHNFTNPSMNKIAWLGQASVSFWARIPREITMEAWNYLDEMIQNVANKIAESEIKRWENCQKNI